MRKRLFNVGTNVISRRYFHKLNKPKLYLPKPINPSSHLKSEDLTFYNTINCISRSKDKLLLPLPTTKTDSFLSRKIVNTTNNLRIFSYTTTRLITQGTNFTVKKIVWLKKYNQRILPTNLLIRPISPIVHHSVVTMKNGAILLNKVFDTTVQIFIWIGKEIGKLIGKGTIIAFKFGRYIVTNKYGAKDFLPHTQQSIDYFFKATVEEGFVVIEAIDDSLTRTFGASTDLILQTIEHCFGENVKDISAELSIMSKETFEFYKKVKLFKLKNIQAKAAKEGTKEIFQVIINELKK